MKEKTKIRKEARKRRKEYNKIKQQKEEREYWKLKKLSSPKGITIRNNAILPVKIEEDKDE